MRLNPLLAITAVLYGVVGLGLTFAPAEVLAALGAAPSSVGSWLAQVHGAALLGFAWLNWLNRYTKTRGILGRPVLLPNLMFITVSFWLTLGTWRRLPGHVGLLACALALGVLSIAFGARFFSRSPAQAEAETPQPRTAA